MSGTPSDASPANAIVPRQRFDPPVQRDTIRISNLYGTTWEPVERLGATESLTRFLRFGRLAVYYDSAADQLPAVASRDSLDPTVLRFNRWSTAGTVSEARLWFLVMPSGQVVAGFSVDVSASLLDVIDILEDCYYLDVAVGGLPLERYACQEAARLGLTAASRSASPRSGTRSFPRASWPMMTART